jgi:hypothetical protein
MGIISYKGAKMSEIKRTPCVICKGDCEIKLDSKGNVYWTTGNNPYPYPLSTAEQHGRCCDECNTTFVIPLRIMQTRVAYREYMELPCKATDEPKETAGRLRKFMEKKDADARRKYKKA